MITENGALGVISAVIGSLGMVLVARIGMPRHAPATGPVDVDEDERVPEVLEVSPEIFSHFASRVRSLEDKVDNLTAVVEAQTVRVSTLERLLRLAMRIIRAANKRLRSAGLEPEPVPAELIPYSID